MASFPNFPGTEAHPHTIIDVTEPTRDKPNAALIISGSDSDSSDVKIEPPAASLFSDAIPRQDLIHAKVHLLKLLEINPEFQKLVDTCMKEINQKLSLSVERMITFETLKQLTKPSEDKLTMKVTYADKDQRRVIVELCTRRNWFFLEDPSEGCIFV
ncbi:hypothetical protein GEMRC1_013120 [Eukaryota sp. GEM-RC1]